MRFPCAGARLAFSAVPSVTRSVDFSDFQLVLIRDPEIWYNATIIMLRAAFRATPQQHASARPGQFGAPMRFLFLFTVAAFALAGCTADQMLSQPLQPLPQGRPAPSVRPTIPSNMRKPVASTSEAMAIGRIDWPIGPDVRCPTCRVLCAMLAGC